MSKLNIGYMNIPCTVIAKLEGGMREIKCRYAGEEWEMIVHKSDLV